MATTYGKNLKITIYGGSHDPEIGIEWPDLDDQAGPILSDKDRRWPSFREAVCRK